MRYILMEKTINNQVVRGGFSRLIDAVQSLQEHTNGFIVNTVAPKLDHKYKFAVLAHDKGDEPILRTFKSFDNLEKAFKACYLLNHQQRAYVQDLATNLYIEDATENQRSFKKKKKKVGSHTIELEQDRSQSNRTYPPPGIMIQFVTLAGESLIGATSSLHTLPPNGQVTTVVVEYQKPKRGYFYPKRIHFIHEIEVWKPVDIPPTGYPPEYLRLL